MEQELQELKKEVANLREDIQGLRADIQSLLRTCGRMDDHISFVDNVYDNIRHPMQSMGRRLFGGFTMPEQHTPQIEDVSVQNN